ncbi:hypothetical protein [Spirosoma oryzicola]|uniref:hypothetical protein n=1 Tax=Spirosoma oryzicola TaxID=2898794 RepID=UPI001E5A4BD7|nr:hypothetical protein [Spirosoma oryzicola]UHG93184.1 hypothetical protein LQ777_09855 [Spirosoma oryzicola]
MDEFEKDIHDAFQMREDKEIKTYLQELEEQIRAEEATTSQQSTKPAETKVWAYKASYWWYATAAILLLTIGLGVYYFAFNASNKPAGTTISSKPNQADSEEEPKLTGPQAKLIEQRFTIQEDRQRAPVIQNVSQYITDSATEPTYELNSKQLSILTNRQLIIKSVIRYDNKLYLNSAGQFYLVAETDGFQPLVVVTDAETQRNLANFTNK